MQAGGAAVDGKPAGELAAGGGAAGAVYGGGEGQQALDVVKFDAGAAGLGQPVGEQAALKGKRLGEEGAAAQRGRGLVLGLVLVREWRLWFSGGMDGRINLGRIRFVGWKRLRISRIDGQDGGVSGEGELVQEAVFFGQQGGGAGQRGSDFPAQFGGKVGHEPVPEAVAAVFWVPIAGVFTPGLDDGFQPGAQVCGGDGQQRAPEFQGFRGDGERGFGPDSGQAVAAGAAQQVGEDGFGLVVLVVGQQDGDALAGLSLEVRQGLVAQRAGALLEVGGGRVRVEVDHPAGQAVVGAEACDEAGFGVTFWAQMVMEVDDFQGLGELWLTQGQAQQGDGIRPAGAAQAQRLGRARPVRLGNGLGGRGAHGEPGGGSGGAGAG